MVRNRRNSTGTLDAKAARGETGTEPKSMDRQYNLRERLEEKEVEGSKRESRVEGNSEPPDTYAT